MLPYPPRFNLALALSLALTAWLLATLAQPALAAFPQANGLVSVAVPDGAGGWYIGGDFTLVGGLARNRLAHNLADYSVDPAWNPNADGEVFTLVVSGSTVYAGGFFSVIGGQSRNTIAALDAVSGSATAWNPNANGEVLTWR